MFHKHEDRWYKIYIIGHVYDLTILRIYPEQLLPAQGLGLEPQQAKKPPAFREGKQVVCAIWVPSGIACPVTFELAFKAHGERKLANFAGVCYNIPTVYKRGDESRMGTGNLTMVYGAVAMLSVLLLIGYLLLEKKKARNFIFLISCVAIVNTGYFLLAAANSLRMAMFANGVSYFGAAYSVLAMLLIISEVCQMKKRSWLRYALIGISTAAFALAASGDWLGLYYTSVDITSIGGMTKLVKEYGPLHILYLLSYVLIMVGIIWYAAKKQRLSSFKYTILLLVAVLLNIGVWAVEQGFNEDFEFLSISYIVTEVILLLIYGMLRDYGIMQPGGTVVSVQMLAQLNSRQINPAALPPGMEDLFHRFVEKVKTLSSAERRILNYYIEGHETADIPDLAFISIHTVKKHNHSIYQKLDVSSRDELMLYIELFRCCDRLDELTAQETVTE